MMGAITTLIIRDLKLAIRAGASWLMGLIFFCIFLALSAIALGGEFKTLRPLAPALIWLAMIFSLLFSFEHMFADDVKDGTLEQYRLSAQPLGLYVIAKMISHWILAVLPLLLAIPLAGLFFNLKASTLEGIAWSLLISSPALIAYGSFAGACLTGLRGGGFLLVLLTIPLLLPVLIFALGGAISFVDTGLATAPFKALAGISLIALAIGIPASAAALKTNME